MRQLECCKPLKTVLIGVEPEQKGLCFGCIIYEKQVGICYRCFVEDGCSEEGGLQVNFKALKRKES